MSAARKRLEEAYAEGGREAIEQDSELRALLAQDHEFGALLESAEELDLRQLPGEAMPEEVAFKIRAATRARRRERRFWPGERNYDMALVAALALMALLPPAVGVWLLDQRSAEFSVLELPMQTVRFVPLAAPDAGGAAGGGAVMQVTDVPTARIVVDGSTGRRLESMAKPLAAGRLPAAQEVHIEALVNAVPFAAGEELVAEAGPAPWSRETRLVRVQVSARQSISAGQIEVAFHADHVASYRLLSASAGAGSAPSGKLEAGEAFVALFEVVPKIAIGDRQPELATVRFRGGGDQRAELVVRESRSRFDAMPAAYRYAAAAAWFGLTLKGEGSGFERIMMTASKSLPKTPEARAFLTLVAQAASVRK